MISLETVMAPAIRYAEDGFYMLRGQAMMHQFSARQLSEFKGSAAAFLKADGSSYGAGEVLRQPDYANTLRMIGTVSTAGSFAAATAS